MNVINEFQKFLLDFNHCKTDNIPKNFLRSIIVIKLLLAKLNTNILIALLQSTAKCLILLAGDLLIL